jgi:hypothetical protein
LAGAATAIILLAGPAALQAGNALPLTPAETLWLSMLVILSAGAGWYVQYRVLRWPVRFQT